MEKSGNSCTIRVFFLKEKPYFLPFYLINFLLSSLKIYLGSYPKNTAACSSYNLRNMVEYKEVSSHHFLILDLFTAVILSSD